MIKYLKERYLATNLRRRVRKIPAVIADDGSEEEQFWLNARQEIRQNILSMNVKTFYDWGVLKHYFILGDEDFIKVEAEAILQSPNYFRYRNAIEDTSYIKMHSSRHIKGSNPTRIHHAYHVQQFEEAMNVHVEDIDIIVEFGGGYGNMCHYVKSLGFKGTYIIIDAPELILLQQYYLKNSDQEYEVINDTSGEFQKNINYGVFEPNFLNKIKFKTGSKLFIGTWSISETSIAFRNKFFELLDLSDFNYFLLAFQEKFFGVENKNYFDRWLLRFNSPDYQFKEISHIPGATNHYLFVDKNR